LEGDVIANITNDPHINYFQNKINEVLLPLRKNKKAIKNVADIEKYATTDKKDHEKYINSINEAIEKNNVATTNILGFMLEEIADDR
jgi:hypothetical protein